MHTRKMGISGSRLFLALAVGLLVVAAWYGGRWSAGGGDPFGWMDGRMHDGAMPGRMSGGGMMSDGRGSARSGAGDFDGEMGLRRCRAMMGTMTGMHRSMESMMGGAGHERGARARPVGPIRR